MKSCVTCGKGPLKSTEIELRREVAGHVFTAVIPATVCEACGEEYTAGEDIGRFEQTIARTLLKARAKPKPLAKRITLKLAS